MSTKIRYIGQTKHSLARYIRAARQDLAGLHDALDMGWDVSHAITQEERRLAKLAREERRLSMQEDVS